MLFYVLIIILNEFNYTLKLLLFFIIVISTYCSVLYDAVRDMN